MPRRLMGVTPWLLVATLTAAGAAAAAGYGLTAPKRYRATAQLLVSPVSANDPTLAGLDIFRDVPGKPAAVQSAAVLVRSPQVADAVRAQLGIRRSRDSLLGDVHAHVAGSSSVVDVTVDDTSAASAAQLANAFVDALIAQRTAAFQSQLTSAIRRTSELLGGKTGPEQAELARRLAVLRSFQGQPDPTLRRATTATAPSSASWPRLAVLVPVGAGIGLALGAVCFLLLTLARRGRAVVGAPEYSRGMSDRAVEALVDRLEQRLAAREAALAARERDLRAKIEELRALEGGAALAELAERERALEERVAAVTERELAVARAAASAQDDAGLRERERALEERVAAVTQRELAVARAAASAQDDAGLREREAGLAERERALEERVAAVTQRELAAARAAAAPVPAARDDVSQAPPPAAPPPPDDVAGAFRLDDLERLVAEHGAAHPDRLDEWESYLFVLREYAAPDGTLPGTFDWLVQDTFGPLLD